MKDKKTKKQLPSATLTFKDTDRGTVDISLVFEPAITDDDTSDAHRMAVSCLEHLKKVMEEA